MIEVEITKSTVAKKKLVPAGKKLILEDSEALFLVSINKAKIVNHFEKTVTEKFIDKVEEETVNTPLENKIGVVKKKRGRPAKI